MTRITGIQNIYSDRTVLAYRFEAAAKPEGIKWVSNFHRHLEMPMIYPTWSGLFCILGIKLVGLLGSFWISAKDLCNSCVYFWKYSDTKWKVSKEEKVSQPETLPLNVSSQFKPCSRLGWCSSSWGVPCKIKYRQLRLIIWFPSETRETCNHC